ncbi:MAG: VTT domain-containing protein [Oscillospiraceae bacterium]|nr:VTT domain-containing protein [Oscillospiraceae bacterium]
MYIFQLIANLLFHLDTFLANFIGQYGILVYLLIFVVLFCETGLFVPFLPGDSLIFSCGAFSALGLMHIWIAAPICFVSAFFGDAVNYSIGCTLGKQLYARENNRLMKRERIDKAQTFYDRHGGKAIISSRFIPLVRQFTPFVAGVGKMPYRKFFPFNLAGVSLWVGISFAAGYFFGNIPAIQDNFTGVLLAIVLISLLPAFVLFVKSKWSAQHTAQQP